MSPASIKLHVTGNRLSLTGGNIETLQLQAATILKRPVHITKRLYNETTRLCATGRGWCICCVAFTQVNSFPKASQEVGQGRPAFCTFPHFHRFDVADTSEYRWTCSLRIHHRPYVPEVLLRRRYVLGCSCPS